MDFHRLKRALLDEMGVAHFDDHGSWKILGTTQDEDVCDLCGKTDLRRTVIVGECDADGNVRKTMHVGTTCAKRFLPGFGKLTSETMLQLARHAESSLKKAMIDAKQWSMQEQSPVVSVVFFPSKSGVGGDYTTRRGMQPDAIVVYRRGIAENDKTQIAPGHNAAHESMNEVKNVTWMAPNKEGSYEATGGTLEDALKRPKFSFVYDGGNVRLYRDYPDFLTTKNKFAFSGHVSMPDSKIHVDRAGSSGFLARTGGTPFNVEIKKFQKWLEKQTGRQFSVSMGETGNEQIADPHGMREITLYHGTTDRLLPNIKKFGLKPGTDTSNWIGTGGFRDWTSQRKSVYLVDNERTANQYADKATSVNGGRRVVLKVRVPTAFLEPDDDYLAMLGKEDRTSATWQSSLKVNGQVAYTHRIPPSKIEVIKIDTYEVKTGKRQEIADYDLIRKWQGQIKRQVNDLIEIYRDLYRGTNEKNTINYISELTDSLDRARSWPEFQKASNRLAKMLGCNEYRDLQSPMEKFKEANKALADAKKQTRPAASILAKHGFTGSNFDEVADEVQYVYNKSDDDAATDRAYKAFKELNDKLDMNRSMFNHLSKEYAQSRYDMKRASEDIYLAAYKRFGLAPHQLSTKASELSKEELIQRFVVPYAVALASLNRINTEVQSINAKSPSTETQGEEQ